MISMPASKAHTISFALTTLAFLLNLFATFTPTWGVSCTTFQATGDEECDRLGLWQWCRSTDGLNECFGFDPATIHKPQRAKNYYYAAQFFMILCVCFGGFYTIISVLSRFLSFSRQAVVSLVSGHSERLLFYSCVGVEFFGGLVTMAIWAHQESTHEHDLAGYGKIYFKFGNAFNTSIVAWIICLSAIVFRYFVVDRAADTADEEVYVPGGQGPPLTGDRAESPYHSL